MKKTGLLLFALALAGLGMKAQSLEIRDFQDTNKVYKNGDTITFYISSLSDSYENSFVTVKNISGDEVVTNLRQRVLNRLENAEYAFCYGNCYEDNKAEVMEGSMTVAAGQITDELCVMDYSPKGSAGTTYVRYTFFNTAAPEDSACVVLKYDDSKLSIAQTAKNGVRLSCYPNPAHQSVQIRLQGVSALQQPVLRICNLLGTALCEQTLGAEETQVRVDVSQWSNGIYFYSILDGSKNIATQKMIVSH